VEASEPTAGRRSWRFQYSLRALLGLVTVVAIFLGWFVSEWRHRQAQSRLVAEYDYTLAFGDPEDPSTWTWAKVPEPPKWARTWFGNRADEFFRTVVAIHCSGQVDAHKVLPLAVDIPTVRKVHIGHYEGDPMGQDAPTVYAALAQMTQIKELRLDACGVEDQYLTMLTGLRNLEVLFIRNGDDYVDPLPITDRGMSHVGKLSSLRKLWIEKTSVTDAGIAHLAKLRFLESLSLWGGHVTGENLTTFRSRDRLRVLKLSGRAVTARGLAQIGQLSGLKELNLGGYLDVEASAYEALVRLEGLEILGLYHANIDAEALAHVGRVQNLRKLDLRVTPLESRDLVHLEGLRNLEELDLSSCGGIGDEGLRHIAKLRNLKKLDLGYTAVTDAGLEKLASLSLLEELDLDYTKISPKGLASLAPLKRLDLLELPSDIRGTPEARQLKKALPNCRGP